MRANAESLREYETKPSATGGQILAVAAACCRAKRAALLLERSHWTEVRDVEQRRIGDVEVGAIGLGAVNLSIPTRSTSARRSGRSTQPSTPA